MGRRDFDFDASDDELRYESRRQGSGSIADYLTFRRMFIPIIIQMLFWIGIIAIIVFAIIRIRREIIAKMPETDIAQTIFIGFGAIIGWRMICEYTILFFRMNETLTAVKNELRRMNTR